MRAATLPMLWALAGCSTSAHATEVDPLPMTVKIYDVDRCQRKVCECEQIIDVIFKEPKLTSCNPNPFGGIFDGDCPDVLCRCRQMLDIDLGSKIRDCKGDVTP